MRRTSARITFDGLYYIGLAAPVEGLFSRGLVPEISANGIKVFGGRAYCLKEFHKGRQAMVCLILELAEVFGFTCACPGRRGSAVVPPHLLLAQSLFLLYLHFFSSANGTGVIVMGDLADSFTFGCVNRKHRPFAAFPSLPYCPEPLRFEPVFVRCDS